MQQAGSSLFKKLFEMTTLKKRPRTTKIQPAYLQRKEAAIYCGIGDRLFREMSQSISVYAKGTKMIFYKVSDLDRMMEGFKIIDRPKQPKNFSNKKALA